MQCAGGPGHRVQQRASKEGIYISQKAQYKTRLQENNRNATTCSHFKGSRCHFSDFHD